MSAERMYVKKAAGTEYIPEIRPLQEWPEQERSTEQARGRIVRHPAYQQAQQGTRVRMSPISSFMMLVTTVVLIACVFAYVFWLSKASEQAKQIASLNTRIDEMQDEIQNLQVKLDFAENIERVRDVATLELGMVSPQEGQIRVLSLLSAEEIAACDARE